MKNRFIRRFLLSFALIFLCAFQALGSPSAAQAANHAPIALNRSITTRENASVSRKMRAADLDRNPLTYSVVSGPSNGHVVVTNAANGSFTYTPNPYWHGTDSFKFIVNDGQLDSNIATETITVTAVNYAPAAVNDSYTTQEDAALVVPVGSGVLLNDTDPDPEDAHTATLVTGPAHGLLTLNSTGAFSYTPSQNWNGTATFTYRSNDGKVSSNTATVTITVLPVNDPPVAASDVYLTSEDTPLVVPADAGVLKNDSDVDAGDAALLTSVLVTGPTQGVLNLLANGSFTYTPNADWNGTDHFTYRAYDSKADSNVATVTLTISLVNDPPQAQDLTFTTDEDTPLSASLSASDPDQDSLQFRLASGPSHGQLSLVASTGSFTYTPDQNWSGGDSFSYTANDGIVDSSLAEVSLTVQPVNDLPVADDQSQTVNEDQTLTGALTAADVDGNPLTFSTVGNPTHGGLALNSDGSFTYTPIPDYHGTDSFTFRANDGAADSNTATVSLAVVPLNDAPAAQDLTVSAAENASASGTLSASDVDADPLTFTIVTAPLNGELVLNTDTGAFTYTPTAYWNGVDSFTFTANDGEFDSNVATVTMTVSHVNHAPAIALIGARQIDELALLSFTVNASDPDSADTLTYALEAGAPAGAAIDPGTGKFTWTPTEVQGPAEYDLTVIVSDSGNPALKDMATFQIQVGEVNASPVLASIGIQFVDQWPFTFTAAATDEDLPANQLTFSLEAGAPAGAQIEPATGVMTWDPPSLLTAGVYHVTVRVTDVSGLADSQTVSIVVYPGIPISGGSVIFLPIVNR